MVGGAEPAEPEASRGVHAAATSGCYERRSARLRGDGRHARTGGGLLHQVRRLHLRKDSHEVSETGGREGGGEM